MTFRLSLLSVVGATLTAGLIALSTTQSDAGETWARSVAAGYRIEVNGIKFGLFNFSSTRKEQQYVVWSNAKLRALFGAFKWRGSSSSRGQMTASGPMPALYQYSAKKKGKGAKTVTMSLVRRNVTALAVIPRPNPNKHRVPLHANDKKNILDPMSAIVAMTAPANSKQPCRQSVHVFDGKHRFDVRLSPKGTKRIEAREGTGFLRRARICRVQYVPIAGHRKGKKSNIVDPNGIELWLVPTTVGGMFVPYRIILPTIIGNAVLQVQTIKVELSNNRRIALVY